MTATTYGTEYVAIDLFGPQDIATRGGGGMTTEQRAISAIAIHRHKARRWTHRPGTGRCWIVWHITRTMAYWRDTGAASKGREGGMTERTVDSFDEDDDAMTALEDSAIACMDMDRPYWWLDMVAEGQPGSAYDSLGASWWIVRRADPWDDESTVIGSARMRSYEEMVREATRRNRMIAEGRVVA